MTRHKLKMPIVDVGNCGGILQFRRSTCVLFGTRGASGGSCRGVLAWPRVISCDVPPLQPSALVVVGAPRLSRRAEQHWRLAGARSMLITHRSLHRMHAYYLASTVLIRAGYTRRRTWILMLVARNGHFSSGNRLPTLCERCRKKCPSLTRHLTVSSLPAWPWLLPPKARHMPRFDPLMSWDTIVHYKRLVHTRYHLWLMIQSEYKRVRILRAKISKRNVTRVKYCVQNWKKYLPKLLKLIKSTLFLPREFIHFAIRRSNRDRPRF